MCAGCACVCDGKDGTVQYNKENTERVYIVSRWSKLYLELSLSSPRAYGGGMGEFRDR